MHIPKSSIYLPRRTFLRGLGACIGLPLLECMLPKSILAAGANGLAAGAAPKRAIFVYMPNGMDMENWTPKTLGANYDLPSILSPLAAHRDKVSVLSGLAHVNARPLGDGAGDHARANACFLTGVHPRKTAGADIHVGASADQVAAQQIGKATRLSSLELTCDVSSKQAGSCDSGYACAYQNSISWRTENTPMPPLVDPRLVFERLFGIEDDPDLARGRALRKASRKSILDLVRGDAKNLQKQLGATDRRKMDEYLTSLRETEVAIEHHAKFKMPIPPSSLTKPDGVPVNLSEHLRLMYDLLAVAMQTDSTRIATFMVLREGSNQAYPFIDITEGHHELSHHGENAAKKAKIAKINQYHIEHFANFLGKLRGMKEGNGTVLDNSMIVLGSAIADGHRHQHDELPVLLCGGGTGSLSPGRHVRYARETPMTNLYLSMFERMGVKADRFGDSTGVLKDV